MPFRGIYRISAFFRVASGPLSRVDHWRAPKQGANPFTS